MIDTLVGLVARRDGWAYLELFVGATLESAAFLEFLVPGETLAILGGFLAELGVLDLLLTIGVVAGGAVVGDNIGYELGR
jgi:membrane protein DedA with SNARE-associated domain